MELFIFTWLFTSILLFIFVVFSYAKQMNDLESDNKEQADTIKRLNCSLDESYVAIEAVANTKKKADRIKLANKYTYND